MRTLALRDFLLAIDDFNGNIVPGPIREARRLAVDLLKKSTNGNLNRCFRETGLEFLDLYGMDFTCCQLNGINFRGSFLLETNFQGSNLAGTSFSGASLRNVEFTGADIVGADFTDADWFNVSGLTKSQLALAIRETVMDCPANAREMRRFLDVRYVLPFQTWPTYLKAQLKSAWSEYLRPNGLRDVVAGWRQKARSPH